MVDWIDDTVLAIEPKDVHLNWLSLQLKKTAHFEVNSQDTKCGCLRPLEGLPGSLARLSRWNCSIRCSNEVQCTLSTGHTQQ